MNRILTSGNAVALVALLAMWVPYIWWMLRQRAASKEAMIPMMVLGLAVGFTVTIISSVTALELADTLLWNPNSD